MAVDDLETMLLASRRLGVPMVVGSAGDTGSNSRVDLFVSIIQDLANKHRLARFRVGYFYSEVSKDEVSRRILAGDQITGLDGRPRSISPPWTRQTASSPWPASIPTSSSSTRARM